VSDAFLGWLNEVEAASGERRWRPYRDYRDTWESLASLYRSHPGGLEIVETGQSRLGRPIWRVSLSGTGDGANVFVVAGLHAMEHVGVAAAIKLIERGLTQVRWRGQLSVIPMANPDGFLEVEAGLAAGQRRFWRKNQSGVDLNRNFAAHWRSGGVWARLFPRLFAPGAAPLSEPEAAAVDQGFRSVDADVAISLHAFGNTLYLPWAAKAERPPRWSEQLSIAERMVSRQPKPYSVRQLGRHIPFFRPSGTELDFFCSEGALSFLFEIGGGPRLRHPRAWHHPYGWFSPPAESFEADVSSVVAAVEALATVSRQDLEAATP
jgi:hypothetical protein